MPHSSWNSSCAPGAGFPGNEMLRMRSRFTRGILDVSQRSRSRFNLSRNGLTTDSAPGVPSQLLVRNKRYVVRTKKSTIAHAKRRLGFNVHQYGTMLSDGDSSRSRRPCGVIGLNDPAVRINVLEHAPERIELSDNLQYRGFRPGANVAATYHHHCPPSRRSGRRPEGMTAPTMVFRRRRGHQRHIRGRLPDSPASIERRTRVLETPDPW